MRDLFVILGSLLIAVLVAAFTVPRFIDWTPYKHEVEARLAAAGLKVTLAGPMRVTLLPEPALNARDVIIEGKDATLTAARLRAQFSFASVLGGAPRVTSVDLIGAVVKLSKAAVDDPASALTRFLSSAGPPLEIDDVSLSTVSVTGPDGTPLAAITTGQGSLDQRQGPLRLDLDGGFGGLPGTLRLAIGAPGGDGRRSVALVLDAVAGPHGVVHLLVDGDAGAGKAAPGAPAPVTVDGKVTLTQAREVTTSRNKDLTLWRAQAKLHAERGLLSFTKLDITRERAAALRFSGTGSLDLSGPPKLSLDLTARRLILDPLIGGSDHGPPAVKGGVIRAATALAKALSGAVPRDLSVAFTVAAEDAELAGESFGKLRIQGVADRDGITLSKLAADWSGRGHVDFAGQAGPAKRGGLSGHVTVKSPDAAAFLQGLGLASGGGATAVPLAFSGDVAVTAGKTRLSGLDIGLAGSHVTGEMTVASTQGGRPARVEASLASTDLDLDAWPLGAVTRIVPATVEGRVEIHVDRLRAGHGTGEAGRLDMAVSRAGGTTRIETLRLRGFGGLTLTGAGAIGGSGSSFNLHVAAPKVAPLVTLSRLVLPRDALAPLAARGASIEPLALDLAGKRGASGQTVDLTLAGSAGATRIDATATLGADLVPTGGTVTLSAPDAAALLAQLGLPVAKGRPLGRGEARLTASPAGQGRAKVTLHFAAGGLDASGDGIVSFAATGPAGEGGFSLSAPSTAIAARIAGWALAGLDAGEPADLAGGWTLTPADLALDRLNGHLAGAALTGRLSLALAGERKLTGALQVPTLSVAAIAGLALGDLGATQGSTWASHVFPAYVPPPWPISIDVSAPEARLGGGIVGRDAKATLSIGDQGVAIDDAAANVAGGVLGGSWRIARDGGLARSVLRLSGAALDIGRLLPDGGPTGSLSGHVELSGAGETLSRIVAGSGGGGTLRVADGTIAHAAQDGLQRAFAKAVIDESLMDKDKLNSLVAAETDAAPLEGVAFEAPLLVTAGVARATVPRREIAPGESMEGTSIVDLKALTLDARLGLSVLSQGEKEKRVPLAAIIAWNGPLFAPKRTADATALLQAVSVERLRRELERIELMESEQREREHEARPPVPAGKPVDSPAPKPPVPKQAAPAAAPAPAPAPKAPTPDGDHRPPQLAPLPPEIVVPPAPRIAPRPRPGKAPTVPRPNN